MFHYHCFGLKIASEIEIPHLLAGGDFATLDVTIHLGQAPHALPDPLIQRAFFQAQPGLYLLDVPGIARYLAREGKEILVDPYPKSTLADWAVFLLDNAFAALIYQRGNLVFHASAASREGKGILLAGPSARGKSSLAAALAQKGWQVLTDEICWLAPDAQGQMCIMPGPPVLRLWKDVIQLLGINSTHLQPVRNGQQRFTLPIESRNQPVKLAACFALSIHLNPEMTLENLSGLHAFGALSKRLYQPALLKGLDQDKEIFPQLTQVANRVKMFTLSQPERPVQLSKAVEMILEVLPDG